MESSPFHGTLALPLLILALAAAAPAEQVAVADPLMAVRDLGTGNQVRDRKSALSGPLTDPGPVWAGIDDTTSFRVRMERHVTAAEETLGELRSVEGSRTVDNTVIPFKNAEAQLKAAGWLATLTLNVHPDAAFRAHAQEWEGLIAERLAALRGDRGLYEALATVDLSAADPGLRYIVGRDLDEYRRNGIDRSADVRERVADLRARITALGTQYGNNIYNASDTLQLSREAFEGMPEDWLAAYSPDADGLLTVELTAATTLPILVFAERQSTRQAAFRAQNSAGNPENLPVIDSIRSLRHELATELGYPSWAAYAAEPMMAGSSERIRQFLDEVDAALSGAVRREIAELLARRRIEEPDADSIDVPSLLYWQNKVKQEAYAFDEQVMREYLPYDRVRDGILATFERMFELDFRPAPGIPVWSPDVEPYEVWEDGKLIGRFYLDMHPREGKFGDFAAFEIRLGGGALPEMALLCSFPGGREGDPGLLQPMAMTTFFHEFGHLVHFLLYGQSPIVGDIELDFIEAPSQLLEEWARDPDVLRSFARHYETGEPIPEELVAAYRRAEAYGRASLFSPTLSLSTLSLELHEAPPADDPTAAVEARAIARIPFEMPDGFRMSTSFPHLNPYSSNYYTYLWSAVIARDLLTEFDRADLLDPTVGRRYRDLILAPMGTAPTSDLIERFLGRPFNADAWRAWLEGSDPGREVDRVSANPSPLN